MESTTLYLILSLIAFIWLAYQWTAKEVYKLLWVILAVFAGCLLADRTCDFQESHHTAIEIIQ